MVDVEMKYKTGDKVVHFTGIHGMITKVSLDNEMYEFVYLNSDGGLNASNIHECEVEGYSEDNGFGFNKNRT